MILRDNRDPPHRELDPYHHEIKKKHHWPNMKNQIGYCLRGVKPARYMKKKYFKGHSVTTLRLFEKMHLI